MALLSDVDWVIIAIVAAYLFLGRGSASSVRTLGRWYGRAVRLKQELLAEVTKAADLPVANGSRPVSLRAALLGGETPAPPVLVVPLHAPRPYGAPTLPPSIPPAPWTGGEPVTSWSSTSVDLSSQLGTR